jgi:localization factor PodJL
MKSGGPWNLRGLRPETREVARDAARRSGVSVGEWLNSVIREDDDDRGEPMRSVDYDDDDDVRRDDKRREPLRNDPRESRYADRAARRRRGRPEQDEPPRRRQREPEIERESALAREEFGEVHARLDRLTQQLERMAQTDAPRLTGAPAPQPHVYQSAPQPHVYQPPPPPPPPSSRAPSHRPLLSVDNAVAEIAQRQRQLYGDDAASRAAPIAPVAPEPAVAAALPPLPATAQRVAEPPVDISNLEEQLRDITARIESLRPSSELENVVKSFRKDLAEIREQLTEALPRRAVQSLEAEVQTLAKRLDQSRASASGIDSGVLAGIEGGLKEVRDALRSLTPAENLVGFEDTVKALSQKVDLIIAKEDPAALQQLETAIGTLRGIVSHVASNDTLTKVAEDVRLLGAKVDVVATSAASGQAVSALESRIDTLASALNASNEAGRAVPGELEKLLSGLIEKLEWVQLTHTDHAALGALEDRIAQLIKRLDASDARFGNLAAVERGIADLLVHIDQIRGGNGVVAAAMPRKPVDAIERDVAEIKRSEQRTQESLEAVHGTVEHVVDRLAMIESGIHDGTSRASALGDTQTAQESSKESPKESSKAPATESAREPALDRRAKPTPPAEAKSAATPPPMSVAQPPAAAATSVFVDTAARRGSTARTPIDPHLPPDHPLEPGSAAGQRAMPSAAERIAASEAAVDFVKPPAISEQGAKPNFIAAARRAAQAAAAAPPERQGRGESAAISAPQSEKPSRLRKLIVAGAAVLIAGVFLHAALRMFQDRATPNNSPDTPPAAPSQGTASPAVLPESDSSKMGPQSGPLILPVPGAQPPTAPVTTPTTPSASTPTPSGSLGPAPAVPPRAPPDTPAAAPPVTQRQSSLPYSADITGSLPRRVPPPYPAQPLASIALEQAPAAAAPAMVSGKLPATIGGPKLRAAAIAGDAAAEFEVANRFADGHGVPQSDGEAVRWLELAAKQALAPAQFRLGAFYEKGIAVKRDLAVAHDLYAAAAAKGNAKAMHNLAVLYAEGINGPADYRTAAQWFHKAADRGITDSQYNLAILYARGIGVEQNYTESYKWFALAAGKGDGDAAKKRDEVAAHLDAQTLEAAKLAVQKWSAEPQPEDAVNAKAPPGGWDAPEHAANTRSRVIGAKPLALEPKLN